MRNALPIALLGAALLLWGVGAAEAAPPANDALSAAQPLSVGQELSATNLEATSEPEEPKPLASIQEPSCIFQLDTEPRCTASVWYSFTAPSTTTYTVETCDRGTDLDTVLVKFKGTTKGALSEPVVDDDSCAGGSSNRGSRITWAAEAGVTYSIEVNGRDADRASFYLRAYEGAAQPRPEPDTATDQESSYRWAEAPRSQEARGVLSGPRHSASFILVATQPSSTFECSLDGAAYSGCTSPVSYDNLAAASYHEFRARATSGGSTDPTPVVERFTIDADPPETTLTAQPPPESPSEFGSWEFAGSEPVPKNVAAACGLDLQTPFGCGNQVEFADLCQGPHSFAVSTWDLAANVDPTPALSQFEVTTGTPCSAPTIDPPTPPTPIATSSGEISFAYDDKGAGGALGIEYGPTLSYGLEGIPQTAGPSGLGGSSDSFYLQYLEPATTYHYRVTLITPFGSTATADQTFTTKPLEGHTPPVIQNGTPRVVGSHAAEIPYFVDPAGADTESAVRLAANEPTGPGSPTFGAGGEIPETASGLQPQSVQVVDLDPGTYHYRVEASQSIAGGPEVLGPEGTFTLPAAQAAAAVPAAAPRRFRLRRRNIRVSRIGRRSKKVIVRLKGLPPRTVVKLKLIVGGAKQSARRKANARGRIRFKVRFSKRVRKALRKRKVRKVRIKVTARPPDERASRVTLTKRLPRPTRR